MANCFAVIMDKWNTGKFEVSAERNHFNYETPSNPSLYYTIIPLFQLGKSF
jgi:hypothetical protein